MIATKQIQHVVDFLTDNKYVDPVKVPSVDLRQTAHLLLAPSPPERQDIPEQLLDAYLWIICTGQESAPRCVREVELQFLSHQACWYRRALLAMALLAIDYEHQIRSPIDGREQVKSALSALEPVHKSPTLEQWMAGAAAGNRAARQTAQGITNILGGPQSLCGEKKNVPNLHGVFDPVGIIGDQPMFMTLHDKILPAIRKEFHVKRCSLPELELTIAACLDSKPRRMITPMGDRDPIPEGWYCGSGIWDLYVTRPFDSEVCPIVLKGAAEHIKARHRSTQSFRRMLIARVLYTIYVDRSTLEGQSDFRKWSQFMKEAGLTKRVGLVRLTDDIADPLVKANTAVDAVPTTDDEVICDACSNFRGAPIMHEPPVCLMDDDGFPPSRAEVDAILDEHDDEDDDEERQKLLREELLFSEQDRETILKCLHMLMRMLVDGTRPDYLAIVKQRDMLEVVMMACDVEPVS